MGVSLRLLGGITPGSEVGSGIYVGNIAISDGREKQDIPVVLEVETEDVFFDINLEIPPNYKEIKKGEKSCCL